LSSSRYAIDEFIDMFNIVTLTADVDEKALGRLLERSSQEKSELSCGFVLQSSASLIHARFASSLACDVGRTLLDLDVELRRTLAFLIDGSSRPLRDRSTVEVLHAVKNMSFHMAFGTSSTFNDLLFSKPLEFQLVFSWFWDHRLNQTRTRPAKRFLDRLPEWYDIAALAKEYVIQNQPVRFILEVDSKGGSELTMASESF